MYLGNQLAQNYIDSVSTGSSRHRRSFIKIWIRALTCGVAATSWNPTHHPGSIRHGGQLRGDDLAGVLWCCRQRPHGEKGLLVLGQAVLWAEILI
jgi:hypothetical protein